MKYQMVFFLKYHKLIYFVPVYKKNKTYVFITHYSKIFSYLTPDEVLVMKEGKLVKKGDKKLIMTIEKEGYEVF